MKAPWTFGPVGEAQRWDRWDRRALLAAVAIGALVFAVKLKGFFNLCYASDLFFQTQLAQSWLKGRFLYDNCFGSHLSIHTYFFLPVLAVFTKPLGAPGLLLALAAAVAVSSFIAHRILRLLGVAGGVALVSAIALVSLPLSLWVYGDALGFHTDLVIPPLGLGLFYALLRGRLVLSLVMTVLVCSVKEDAPMIAGVVAAMVVVETWLGERRLHRPALASLILTAVLFVVLFRIKQSQPHSFYMVDHIAILKAGTGGAVHGPGSLLAFIVRGVPAWFAYSFRQLWPLLFLTATLGFLLVRPWFAPLGFVTTIVPWLLGGIGKLQLEGLNWSNRCIALMLFAWCVILLGFASVLRWAATLDPQRRRTVARVAGVVVFGCIIGQLHFATSGWEPLEFNIVRPGPYSAAERRQADALFATYRREGRPEEPVATTPPLFRYAHDRNLYWLDRLQGRPRPVWILQDSGWKLSDFGIRSDEYSVVGSSGRFVLLKRAGS